MKYRKGFVTATGTTVKTVEWCVKIVYGLEDELLQKISCTDC